VTRITVGLTRNSTSRSSPKAKEIPALLQLLPQSRYTRSAARFKHSCHLARHSRLVIDVHGNGVRPDMIKGAILERQSERIPLSDLDPVPEPASCAQNSCRFDEVGRKIDGRHPTTAFGCEIARRSAEAATNFKYEYASLQSCAFRMLARRHRYPGCAAGRTATDRDGWASRDPLQQHGVHHQRAALPANLHNNAEPSPRRRSSVTPRLSSWIICRARRLPYEDC
jgi:hypothetical protein